MAASLIRRVPGGTIWRIIREIDLEALRRDAGSRFEVLIAADALPDAEAAVRLIGPHPWLVTAEAAGAPREGHFTAAVLVSRATELSPSLTAVRDRLGAQTPVLTLVVGPSSASDRAGAVPRRREHARVAVADLAQDSSESVNAVAAALLTAVPPDLRLAVARQLPRLRETVSRSIIDETARANAAYAFTSGLAEVIPVLNIPMNIGDIVVLTKNQLVMSYKLALAAGKSGAPRAVIGEVLGVLGGGFLFRQVARQLVGLIPVAGVVSKVAVAYAGTWAIGRAVTAWAELGDAVTPATVRRYYKEGLSRGREVARLIVPRRRGG